MTDDRPGPWRRLDGSDTWHWIRECTNWPEHGYIEKATKPMHGDQCNECRAKERARSE